MIIPYNEHINFAINALQFNINKQENGEMYIHFNHQQETNIIRLENQIIPNNTDVKYSESSHR